MAILHERLNFGETRTASRQGPTGSGGHRCRAKLDQAVTARGLTSNLQEPARYGGAVNNPATVWRERMADRRLACRGLFSCREAARRGARAGRCGSRQWETEDYSEQDGARIRHVSRARWCGCRCLSRLQSRPAAGSLVRDKLSRCFGCEARVALARTLRADRFRQVLEGLTGGVDEFGAGLAVQYSQLPPIRWWVYSAEEKLLTKEDVITSAISPTILARRKKKAISPSNLF